MQQLTDFELVLINGEVVQQDIGYNSMLGEFEPENWFWFDERHPSDSDEKVLEVIEEYKRACDRLPWAQSSGKNIHLINCKIPNENYSVMCIPAKSILCIRKIEPPRSAAQMAQVQKAEQESVETLTQEEQHGPSRKFERRRRPVIRKRETKK